MNCTCSFAKYTGRAFDTLSLKLQISDDDDNFMQELEAFHEIMDNNGVDQVEFWKYLDFVNEDEDCAICSRLSTNYATHVTFADVIIEGGN